MKERLYALIEVAFIMLFIYSLLRLVVIYQDYKHGDEIYAKAQEYVNVEGSGDDFTFDVDMDALQKINPDIYGWIIIPDTPVNYPLIVTDNNKYYLKHTYDKIYSDFGSIFIDCNCSLLDYNTVIYGHNTKNESMFGSLKKYKSADYYKQHPSIYILYEGSIKQYDIIAALTVEVTDPAYEYSKGSAKLQKLWLEDLIGRSEVPTLKTTPVTGEEKIITLSTCTSRTKTERFIVIAEEV